MYTTVAQDERKNGNTQQIYGVDRARGRRSREEARRPPVSTSRGETGRNMEILPDRRSSS